MGLIDSKRAQRLYDQVAGNRKNCAYKDLEHLLEAVWFVKRTLRGGSSHVTFKRGTAALTVPRRKPVKEHYVDEALRLIDEGTPWGVKDVRSNVATDVPAEVQRLEALPYARELLPNDDGTWFARIVEFAGCMSEGDTQAEAIAMLDDAMTEWLIVKLEDGEPIPEAMAPDRFPGKFLVRTTRSLHRDLVRRAEREGVSLNHNVVTKLASNG